MTRQSTHDVFWFGIAMLIFGPIFTLLKRGAPVTFLIPNILLYSGFRNETRSSWKNFVVYDNDEKEPTHIPVIESIDFTFDVLKFNSDGFKNPVVVRGMFKDTPAIQKWADPEYLPSKIGHFKVPVDTKNIYGTLHTAEQFKMMPISDPFHESRMTFNDSDPTAMKELQIMVNKLVHDDLQVEDKLWRGFGTASHATYKASQIIIGRGSSDDKTTGSGWHCAGGNNWFVQVAGRKRWYFLEPKYSPYMYPLRGGLVHFTTGNMNMLQQQKHLPLRYVDLEAGDMLYNPDWHWHTIKNYEGLSIGVPMREGNISLLLQNNLHFSAILMVNKLADALGIDIGGYPQD